MKPLLVICAICALAAPELAHAKPHKDRDGQGPQPVFGGGMFGDDDGGKPRGKPDRGNQGRGGAYGGPVSGPRRQVPLDSVISQIRRRSPGGRLLDAHMEGGGQYYRVVWATADGRRIDYLVDAETGAILREED